MGPQSLIVMMTDFGTEHWYDAAMKGEILRRAAEARILDLSHHVPRHSIEQAAFVLQCAVDSFPSKTIFLCVVDPGVGSDRRTLVGWVGKWGFVGPDNGLITPLLDRSEGYMELHEIKSPTFRNPKVSATFHGRDLFAPAAGRLWLGDDPRMAGPRVTDPVRLPARPVRDENGRVLGRVMLIDHFGNAVTNVDRVTYEKRLSGAKFELVIRELTLHEVDLAYGACEQQQPLCYWGSSDFLEIAINYGSVSETYGIEVGDAVEIKSPS